jgi:hypothetical protein
MANLRSLPSIIRGPRHALRVARALAPVAGGRPSPADSRSRSAYAGEDNP